MPPLRGFFITAPRPLHCVAGTARNSTFPLRARGTHPRGTPRARDIPQWPDSFQSTMLVENRLLGKGFRMATFDPYHIWLGIPPKDQPPTLYRLLGLDQFERAPEIIDTAATRQMS